jgi:hypothetical protein
MANNLKTNPVGIDKAIQKIQESLYNKLGYSNIDGFGRVYRIYVDGRFVPAHFKKGTDYDEVFYNDKGNSKGNFFFYVEPVSNYNTTDISSNVNLIFQLDVNAITDSLQRNDEEVLANIMKILKPTSLKINTITRGIKALEDFDTPLTDIKILFIKLSGKLNYNINC